ncbi:tape measure protein [Corynebacterium parakroppenstedtii]|uniref:tape measure protein n=1 Tax=Corynebacterium parakroppenstedtii TaxID=2828363 RepID=UPI001C8E0CEF|nr:tape measure protein [Corynebacterium parakroppenstedtii]MBY0797877.1 transglycosylase SLT domain-containing protein [Corynebacterium parakroppenstedtii]
MAVRSVGTARLEVVPDLGGFQKKLASGIRGMRDVTIPVKADTAKAENKLAGLTKGKTTEVKAEADTGKAENKLGGLSKARTVSIGAQADTARAQSELSAVSKDRQVKFFGVSDFTGVQAKVQSVTKWAAQPLKFTGTFDGGPVKAGVASTSATVSSAATSMGSRLSSALSSGANRAGSAIRSSMNGAASAISSLHGPITRIGGAFAGLAGASAIFGAGFKRLNDIQRAEVMFHSIGLTASQTKAQMKQLSDQVTGTSVSLSDAAKYSAMFAQSGVKMGKPMNDAIHAFTNLSSIAEGSGVDVGRVMQQISAQGKMTGGDLMQMGDAGVNATKYLADSMHMSQADVKKAISDGKVSFQDFVTAINQGTGDLGKEMGETLPAKLSNMKTAFANLGASILEPFVGPITSAVTSLTGALKTVTPVIGAVLGGFVGLIQHCPPLQWALIAVTGAVTALIGAVMAVKVGAVLSSWFTVPEIGAFIGSMMETIGILGLYALEWVKTAGTAVLSAGRIAGAWLMAAPKNLLSISRAFLVMTGGWIKSAAVAVASAAQHAVAWVIAAPKNPLVWARAFATMIAGWGRSAAVALVSAGQHAIAWLLAAPKNMGRMALAFTTMIGGWIKSAAIAMVSAAQIAIAWMISLGPIALVIGAVVAVIGIFVALWRQCEGFRNFFIGMWDGIVAAWNAAIGVFSGSSSLWSGIWSGIVSGAQWVWDVLKGIGDYIGGAFMGALGTLAGWIGTAFNAAASAVMMAWSFMQPVFDWIGQRVSDIVNVVGPIFQAIWGQLQAFGAWIAGWWMGSIQPILDQIGSKISEFVQNHWPIIKMILIALGTVLLAPIVIALGAVAIAIGAVIVVVGAIVAALVGLVDLIVHIPGWVSDMVSAVVNWFRNLWQGIKDACSAAGSAISGWFSEHIAPLPGKIGSKLGEVISWFSRLPGRIKSALGDTGSMLVSAGKDMVRGLINGIESMAGAAMDKAKHLASNVANAFKSALHIHSPSRVFMGFGENIGQGLINGMDSMQSDVATASENLAAAADTTLPPSVQALSDKGTPAEPSAVAQPQTQSGSTQTPQDTQGVQGDPAAVFNNMAASLQATADSVLTPMWVGQQGQVTAWGQGVALTASGVVNPAFSSMASFMLATKTGIIDPVMAGLGQNVTNLGTTTQQGVFGVITPTWQQMGANIVNVKTGTIDPAFAGIQGGLNNTVRAFAVGATGIANEWNRVREATAAPVRFAISSVFNDGIVGMWNSASELLGTPKMGTYPVRFATGGYVSGPGGPKDDKVPALLSNGEFVMNAKAVNSIGRDNLAALNSGTVGVAPGVFTSAADVKAALNDKTFGRAAGRYQGGGLAEGTPAWKALLRGYNWARSRNGRPYVWGGSADGAGGADCSGFMSGIADVILGGNGHRQWATMSFPGPQQGAWAPGLAAGFSVGISSEHTAGTIGGAPGMPAVNVESGGINSRMKFGTPDAAGANHSQFPRKYHLIVTDAGTFVPGMGGGASMADIIGGLIKPFKDKMTSAAADWARSHPGTFNRVPSAIADKLGNAAEKKILAMSEEMMGDPGGSGVERWRPMVKRAMAYVGFNANDEAQVNAMLRQIQTESSGNPRASQGIHDVNSGGNEAEGLMQVAKSTWRAYRDPTLPDDWYNPYANMVAALRYYKARYGNNLTTNMGHGIGYDRGGVASGVGFLAKYTQKPERVLSPTQTAAFDRLVTVLERDGVPQGMSQNTVVGQQVTNQYLMNPDDVLRSNRRAMKSALLEGGIRV